jgi:hypothetical protein
VPELFNAGRHTRDELEREALRRFNAVATIQRTADSRLHRGSDGLRSFVQRKGSERRHVLQPLLWLLPQGRALVKVVAQHHGDLDLELGSLVTLLNLYGLHLDV